MDWGFFVWLFSFFHWNSYILKSMKTKTSGWQPLNLYQSCSLLRLSLAGSPKQCTGWRVRLAKAAQLQTVLSSYSPSEVDAFSSSCTRHWCWCLSAPQHSDLSSALHIKMDCFGSSFQFSGSHMPLHYSGRRAKLPKAARAYVLTWGSLVWNSGESGSFFGQKAVNTTCYLNLWLIKVDICNQANLLEIRA